MKTWEGQAEFMFKEDSIGMFLTVQVEADSHAEACALVTAQIAKYFPSEANYYIRTFRVEEVEV